MNKEVVVDLGWGVGIVVLALAASLARQQGLIDTDTVNRLVMGAIGLMVAWFGNRMPKRFVPSPLARRVNRVGGWSLALSGLVYAGLWAFGPFDVAVVGGCAAILAGLAVTIGYCLVLRSRSKAL
ncbi:ammonium transporter [Caulobacter flavus]|uniref:ammonium transporter n=1 Tax=Caulobacter flavus TaxID=1679497 RepID=UPI0015DE0EDD|nr:ammonium transporter [Caulobacter flavus]